MGFWGDMLKILAHQGLATGGTVLGQALAAPLIAKREAQQQVLKSLLPGMSSDTSEEERQALASRIKDISGVSWPTTKGINPANPEVVSPEGARLTAPPSLALTDLASGYKTAVEPVSSLVKTPMPLEQMKVETARGLSPIERKTAFFPKDATLEAAKYNLLANLEFKGKEGEANRELRKQIALIGDETKRMMMGAELTKAQERANDRKLMFGLLGQKHKDTDQGRYVDRLTKINSEISTMLTAGKTDGLEPLIKEYQGVRNIAVKKYPELDTEFPHVTGFTPAEHNWFSANKPAKLNIEPNTSVPTTNAPESIDSALIRRGYKKDPVTGKWSK